MSDNVPEIVDLDEAYNNLNPLFLERALRRNMTASIRAVASRSAQNAMPVMLMGALGAKPTVRELEEALLDAYTALAITVELSKLTDEIGPLEEVDDISDDRKPEIKELIARHPMIKKAARKVKETLAELHGK